MKHKSYLKSKLNQKPQFLSTLLANFWYFTISRHVPNGNLLNFGPSPPQKTFQVLDLCEYVGYFPLIKENYVGIFKQSKSNVDYEAGEIFDLATYFKPFSLQLWIFLAFLTLVITGCKSLIMYFDASSRIIQICNFLWTSMIANFGGKPSICQLNQRKSYKFIIFISLLCGNIVWIFYRSQMNAVLSIRSKSMPFNDFNSFAKTDWR